MAPCQEQSHVLTTGWPSTPFQEGVSKPTGSVTKPPAAVAAVSIANLKREQGGSETIKGDLDMQIHRASLKTGSMRCFCRTPA